MTTLTLNTLESIIFNYNFDCKLRYIIIEYEYDVLTLRLTELLQTKDPEFFDFTITFAKDFAIASDLLKEEKKLYVKHLFQSGFFDKLNEIINYPNIRIRASIIYNVGKFSIKKNSYIIENFYESTLKFKDPFLSVSALFELEWLHSKKVSGYISDLINSEDILDNLTIALLYCTSDRLNQKKDYYRKDLANLINTSKRGKKFEDFLTDWLWDLKIYIHNLDQIHDRIYWEKEYHLKSIQFFSSNRKLITKLIQERNYNELYNLTINYGNGG